MGLSRYKICVYAITKNEEAFVDRWMDAVNEADGVFVADTGSTDGTVARLRARGAIVHEETVTPWRFDTARNIALSHVPEDADICVSNDLDEVFEPGCAKNWKLCGCRGIRGRGIRLCGAITRMERPRRSSQWRRFMPGIATAGSAPCMRN